MELSLLLFGLVLFVSILLTPLSARLGVPLLLLFLGMGMLVGEQGLLDVAFDDFELAYHIGTVALALILLSGGLDTPVKDLREASGPAFVLATVGVVVTTAVIGAIATIAFDMPVVDGLLLGAVIGSTDAAATFLLLRQAGVA